MDFATALAMLDAQADNRLGDLLFYRVGGVVPADEQPVRGFIYAPHDLVLEEVDGPIDTANDRIRLKISRLIVNRPTRSDRVLSDHALLAGRPWRPTNWRPVTSGRRWLIDLDEVP